MSEDAAVKERAKDLLLDHQGADNPITSRELNEKLDLDNVGSFPSTRALVREIVIEDQIPIAGTNQGYFVIETEAELSEYLDNLNSRIESIIERRFAVRLAAKGWHEDIETSADEDLL